jgi:hypothetical protein
VTQAEAFQALPEHLLRKRIKKRPGLYRTARGVTRARPSSLDEQGHVYDSNTNSVTYYIEIHTPLKETMEGCWLTLSRGLNRRVRIS